MICCPNVRLSPISKSNIFPTMVNSELAETLLNNQLYDALYERLVWKINFCSCLGVIVLQSEA